MSESTPRIIGLQKTIASAETGAEAHFHVVKAYSVNHIDGSSAVSLLGYVSREVFDAGKGHLLIRTRQIAAAPMAGRIEDLPTWFAKQVLALADDPDFAGATPVHAAAAPAEEPAA